MHPLTGFRIDSTNLNIIPSNQVTLRETVSSKVLALASPRKSRRSLALPQYTMDKFYRAKERDPIAENNL
jgi:hypothetical protein